MIGFGLNAW